MKALLALSAAVAAVLTMSAASAEDTRDLGLTVAQTAAYQVSVPVSVKTESALKVTAWVDRENNTYHVGENVQLYVRTNKDAFVTVINVGASGATTVLFPNQFQRDNLVRAGQITEIPGAASPARITVGGPVGTELIKVIASTKSRQVFQQTSLQAAGPWQAVSVNLAQWTRDLSLTLQGQPGAVSTVSTVSAAPVAAVTTTQVVETDEWDSYNKVIRTVAAPSVAPASVIVVPGAPVITTSVQAVAVSAPFLLAVTTPKPTFTIGEVVPIQVMSQSACNLVVTASDGSVIYPATGQPVLIQANQPFVVQGVTAQAAQALTAVCRPVGLGRDAGDAQAASTQITFVNP